jgi:hypothetical protein
LPSSSFAEVFLLKLVIMLISMVSTIDSYQPGDLFHVSDEVAEAWVEAGHAKLYEEPSSKVADLDANNAHAEPVEGLEIVSRGVYRLPNGEIVHGKKKAEDALQEYRDQLIEQIEQIEELVDDQGDLKEVTEDDAD